MLSGRIVMKKLTREEYQDRIEAVNRAMRIFSHMTDNDVTKSFTAYQEILAEKEREINLPLSSMRITTGSIFDSLERPKCPDCGEDMYVRSVPQNDSNINSQLICSNNTCDVLLNSTNTIDDWIKELSKQ
jgi:hypothetical protein